MPFHYKDGIFFDKKEDGTVVVQIKESAHPDAKMLHEFKVDKDSWCSIIVAVSKEGETSEQGAKAIKFHGF